MSRSSGSAAVAEESVGRASERLRMRTRGWAAGLGGALAMLAQERRGGGVGFGGASFVEGL